MQLSRKNIDSCENLFQTAPCAEYISQVRPLLASQKACSPGNEYCYKNDYDYRDRNTGFHHVAEAVVLELVGEHRYSVGGQYECYG